MKRNKLVSIAAITVALGVLATGCAGGSGSSKSDSKSSSGTKTVTVKAGTGANVKPYTYVGDDNETTGYDVEVLKEVFDRLRFIRQTKLCYRRFIIPTKLRKTGKKIPHAVI